MFLSAEVRELPGQHLVPLAGSGPLELAPGAAVEWIIALPGAVAVRHLNPVCQPMIEG